MADPFRENEEYLWYHHGLQTKKAMHGGGMRTVDPSISIHANKELLQEQKAEWDSRKRIIQNSGLADLMPHVSLTESFTGSVPQKVVGGKAYWHEAFIELIAMAQMYGVPEFFVTFTANIGGRGGRPGRLRRRMPPPWHREYLAAVPCVSRFAMSGTAAAAHRRRARKGRSPYPLSTPGARRARLELGGAGKRKLGLLSFTSNLFPGPCENRRGFAFQISF